MRRTKISARRSLLGSLLDRGPLLTPLIDIIFLVLIFFMVNNSPAQRSLGVLPPYMPSAPEQQLGATEETGSILLLAVRPDLSYSIQLQNLQDLRILQEWHSPAEASQAGSAVALQALQQQLATLRNSLLQGSPKVRRIRLRADRSLDYGSVIAISDLIYQWQLPLELDVSESAVPNKVDNGSVNQ